MRVVEVRGVDTPGSVVVADGSWTSSSSSSRQEQHNTPDADDSYSLTARPRPAQARCHEANTQRLPTQHIFLARVQWLPTHHMKYSAS